MSATHHHICPTDDLPPGACRIVDIERRSIGIYNVDGAFFAIRNRCPHQFAPLCEGKVAGTNLPGKVGEFTYGLEGQVVRCPWHGWEFDVKTGKSLFNPHRCRVKSYTVLVETGDAETPETCEIASDAEDPSVETYPVKNEGGWVTLVL